MEIVFQNSVHLATFYFLKYYRRMNFLDRMGGGRNLNKLLLFEYLLPDLAITHCQVFHPRMQVYIIFVDNYLVIIF